MSYLQFKQCGTSYSGLTKLWAVLGAQDKVLGSIRWYAPWRKYCFYTLEGGAMVFDVNCLREIADFCEAETRSHNAG